MASNEGYGFMRSGGGQPSSSTNMMDEHEIKQILSLFISNSLITATKYSKFCKRNGVTKDDINLGLKYEVREFFERNTLVEDLNEIQEEYTRMENEEPIKFKVEYVDTRVGTIEESDVFDDEDAAEEFICEQEKYDYYTEFTIVELTESDLLMDDMIAEDSEIDEFKKISLSQIRELTRDDIQLVGKIHRHDESWSSWEPETPLHSILKNGIEKMMHHN
jgi:hypothetical protein